MKAVLCHAFGPPESLVLGEVPPPVPGPHQVLVRVHAAGVNFPDLLMVQGLYQFKPPFPFSPGGEVAGVIEALGPDVADLAVGQAVVGFCGSGGFAESVAIDARRVMPVPQGMDLTTAAGFTLTYSTSYHALRDRAALRPGESLLVLGAAGGVGLAAVEIGKALGARVIAAAGTDDKLAVCTAHGADAVINYTTGDLRAGLRGIVGAGGVDVVYDPVGGAQTEAALRSMAWEGRFLVVGFAAGDIPRIPLNLVLLKGCQIVGVFWGQFAERQPQQQREHFGELSRWYQQGRLRPEASATYPLERAAEALRALAERRVVGKVCVTVGGR